MRAARCRQIFVFGLVLLCLGCVPVVARSGIPGQERTPTPTRVATQRMPSPSGGRIITVKVTPPAGKTKESPRLEYPLTSGGKLALKGGLTEEARQVLKSGKTGYFLLTFTTPGAPSNIQTLKDAGFKVLGNGEYVEAPPATLEVLEAWSHEGRIVFCGMIPPVGKIDPKIAEAASASENGSIKVNVFLLKSPDDAEKRQIKKLFVETKWPLHVVERYPFFTGTIQEKNVARLAEFPIVLSIELPPVMRSN